MLNGRKNQLIRPDESKGAKTIRKGAKTPDKCFAMLRG